MSILVTGGTGFLGASVVRELADLDEELVLLQRPGHESEPVPKNATVVVGDVTDLDDVGGAMVGCRRVVHMAAEVGGWTPDPERFRAVNLLGLRNVIRAASFAAVEHIVYTSTVLALGSVEQNSSPEHGVGDEERPATISVPSSRYVTSKVEALIEAQEHISRGAPITILYPGILYGPCPHRELGWLSGLIADLVSGRRTTLIGRGDRRWCFAHTDDVARGHRLALERGEPGRSYVLGGPNASLSELLDQVDRARGTLGGRRSMPYGLAKVVAVLEVMAAQMMGRQPRLTTDLVDIVRRDWEFTSRRAEAELGYRARSLADGIAHTLRGSEPRDGAS